MRKSVSECDVALNLRPGELVEVRSEEEILATLDEQGRLDAQPFMPEMLKFCGKQYRVSKRADKTCDTISNTGSRLMRNTVYLDELRCDGAGHDGCQARCLIFWKEAWLKRVRPNFWQRLRSRDKGKSLSVARDRLPSDSVRTIEALNRATRRTEASGESSKTIFTCQATEHLRASTALPWWDVRQYYRDVCWGNAGVTDLTRAMFLWAFNRTVTIAGYRALTWSYDRFQKMREGVPYPFRHGVLAKTPSEELDLQPGQLVQVKSYPEILATLDQRNRNRGLSFDAEMVPYCGGKYRVLDRVEHIVNEKSGEMTRLPGVCIMMEDVKCRAWYSDRRVACPRAIYSYWREIWLKPADEPRMESQPEPQIKVG
jgi:hypothetical protein